MKIEIVRRVLEEIGFSAMEEKLNKDFKDRSIEIWEDDTKVVFLKEYRSKVSFSRWLSDDQPLIATLYDSIPIEKKNNLYFIIVLNYDGFKKEYMDDTLSIKINKAERDAYVCKKYILLDEGDFNKISFTNKNYKQSPTTDYNYEFLETLLSYDNLVNSINEEENIEEFKWFSESILNFYFEDYMEFKNNENSFSRRIEQIRKGDMNNEN